MIDDLPEEDLADEIEEEAVEFVDWGGDLLDEIVRHPPMLPIPLFPWLPVPAW